MKLTVCLLLSIMISPTFALADNSMDLCRPKWGNDYQMLEYCIQKDRKAQAGIDKWWAKNYDIEILEKCNEKWTSEYTVDNSMVLYCLKKQGKAKDRLREMGY